MKWTPFVGLAFVIFVTGTAPPPPPTAKKAGPKLPFYALIEKVVLEPNEQKPERIQIWGAFVQAKDKGFTAPARGYVYCVAGKGEEAACQKEWAELKKLAGTLQGVGFPEIKGKERPKVRKHADKPESPDEYPVSTKLTKVSLRTTFPEIRALIELPLPVSPAENEEVEPGKVTLVVKNVQDPDRKNARYLFELESANGQKDASPAIASGDKETKWTPRMEIKAGVKYTWRVWGIDGDWMGPTATAEFVGKKAP